MTDGTVPAAAVTGRTVPADIILPQVPRGRQPRSRDAPRGVGLRGIRGDRRLLRTAESLPGRTAAKTRHGAGGRRAAAPPSDVPAPRHRCASRAASPSSNRSRWCCMWPPGPIEQSTAHPCRSRILAHADMSSATPRMMGAPVFGSFLPRERNAPRALERRGAQVIDPAVVPQRARQARARGEQPVAREREQGEQAAQGVAADGAARGPGRAEAFLHERHDGPAQLVEGRHRASAETGRPAASPGASHGVRLSAQSRTGTRTTVAPRPSATAASPNGCSGESIT